MPEQITIRTERLLLRPWRDSDREPFAAMNADPAVMEFFPSVMSADESRSAADRIQAGFAERGWGLWTVEVPGDCEFVGFVGLAIPRIETQFTPCVELGWRLMRNVWGHGYATEAAHAAAFGFEKLGLSEIVAYTAVTNLRSRRVMERLRMKHDPAEDFDHPALSVGHALRRHVLYRLARLEEPNETTTITH